MDVFGPEVSIDYEKPDIYHVFYSNNEDSLIDATLDLENGELVYLRESYEVEEHKNFLKVVDEKIEELEERENSYDFADQVNNYAGY